MNIYIKINDENIEIEFNKTNDILYLKHKISEEIGIEYSEIDLYKTLEFDDESEINDFLLKDEDIIIENAIKKENKYFLGYKKKDKEFNENNTNSEETDPTLSHQYDQADQPVARMMEPVARMMEPVARMMAPVARMMAPDIGVNCIAMPPGGIGRYVWPK